MGMQALLGLREVSNPQQLQGPVLHRVRANGLAMGRQGAKHKGRQRLQANGLNAGPLALPLVSGLEEGDRHGFALVAGAGQAANAIDNLKGGRGAEAAAIEQKALTTGHPYQPANGVFQQGRRHDQDASTPEGRWAQWRAT